MLIPLKVRMTKTFRPTQFLQTVETTITKIQNYRRESYCIHTEASRTTYVPL